ncbi:MAG: ETC complex I subunit, partial [Novosphingobium sp. 16-62-11]
MSARIYQRPKNAMQSGKARTSDWILEFEPAEAKRPDPLMGWAGSGDTQAQVVLAFASQDEAQAYADR